MFEPLTFLVASNQLYFFRNSNVQVHLQSNGGLKFQFLIFITILLILALLL